MNSLIELWNRLSSPAMPTSPSGTVAGQLGEGDVRVDEPVVGQVLGDHRDRAWVHAEVCGDALPERRQLRALFVGGHPARLVDVPGEGPHEVTIVVVEHVAILARRDDTRLFGGCPDREHPPRG